MTPDRPPAQPAGLFRRLAAILYDSLLLFGLWTLASGLLLLASGGRLADPDRPFALLVTLQCALALITGGFFLWFWTHGGQTLGMRAWRLKLVTRNGGPVTLRQGLVRLAAALLALAPGGLGLLWVLVDPRRRAWHDRWSGTQLIVVPRDR
jgi:uncharacterized RDD family membrane protein YckC